MERKGTIRSKEKREIEGKGGELGIMGYVSRIVEVRYWQPCRLAPLKCLAPPWPFHSKKLAPPLLNRWCYIKFEQYFESEILHLLSVSHRVSRDLTDLSIGTSKVEKLQTRSSRTSVKQVPAVFRQ